jgi:hypothetical protein
VRRRAQSPRPEGVAVLSNANRIDAPALPGNAAIAAHPPAQNIGAGRVREIHRRGDKPARVPGPRLPTCERIATATADRPVVTAVDKRAIGSNNVLKG